MISIRQTILKVSEFGQKRALMETFLFNPHNLLYGSTQFYKFLSFYIQSNVKFLLLFKNNWINLAERFLLTLSLSGEDFLRKIG